MPHCSLTSLASLLRMYVCGARLTAAFHIARNIVMGNAEGRMEVFATRTLDAVFKDGAEKRLPGVF